MKGDLVYLFLFLSFLDDAFSAFPSRVPHSSCPNIILKNGKVKRRQRGRFVKFVCNTGYLLSGERYSTCNQGKWDPSPPKCVRPTCSKKVLPPTNGLIYPSHSGAALHFFCKTGYELKGPTDIYCDGWKWDNNVPSCLPINSKPKLFCDFEESDICGWTHDLNHDFDWKRENFNTPSGSIGTGPSFDHTKGAGQDGYYMYIESSSKNENDTARLISPVFNTSGSNTCLEFFYHMYGATTGTLRVYVKKISDNWNLDPRTAIFSKSGNQGDKWYRSINLLEIIDEEYQIVIEGVRGSGYVSDTAVDDVKIIENCDYEDETFSTSTQIPYSTEVLLTVESCENRCGHKAFGNETLQISCDCDDDCYFRGKCCPDYFDFCVRGSSTDDYYTSTDMPNEINPSEHIQSVVHNTSEAPAGSTTKSTVPTTKSTLPVRTTIIIKPTAPKKTTTTTNTATKASTKPSTSIPRVTQKNKLYPPAPTIQVLKPPITPAIVQKVLPTIRTKPKVSKTPKIIFIKPKPVKPKESEDNDVMEMPTPKNNDKELLLNLPLPKNEEKELSEVENHLDSPYMRNFSESHTLLSQRMPDEAHYNIVIIVITIIGIAVLTSVIAVFVVKRYRCSTRRMNYSNGESQSEIRFITNDETIDLSLDRGYDDDY